MPPTQYALAKLQVAAQLPQRRECHVAPLREPVLTPWAADSGSANGVTCSEPVMAEAIADEVGERVLWGIPHTGLPSAHTRPSK